jgi:multidrug resistance efflux pump
VAESVRRSRFPWIPVAVLAALAGGGAWLLLRDSGSAAASVPTWTVRKDTLEILVTEGGSVQPLKDTPVISKVEGDTQILSIVPEGTVVTEEDVAKGLVLVELDASEIRNKINRQAIAVADAAAGLAQAEAALEILKNQNDSDLRKAQLDVRFAHLDLEKYLGTDVAGRAAEAPPAPKAAPAAAGAPPAPAEPRSVVAALVNDPALGGEALQQKRKLQADIDLANEEATRAKDKLAWTEKLLGKGYVSADEREADRLALKRQEVALEQAKTALDLFDRYEFGKQVESFLSTLLEAKEAQRRTESKTASALADAQADLRSKEARRRLEDDLMAKLAEQEKSCVIRATRPGIVVYATSVDRGNYMGDQSPIQAGTKIHERQAILSIPDPQSTGVRVNVHESALDKVKVGQEARVRVDAFPDRAFRGRVARVSTVPNAQNRWNSPDLKVYATDVAIESAPPDVRTGLSARVEIRVAEIPNALAVPNSAIAYVRGKPNVWVRGPGGDGPRPVVLGMASDRMIEVKQGLAEGDVVLLAPPKEPPRAGGTGPDREEKPSATTPPPEGQPATSPGPGRGRGRRGRGGGGEDAGGMSAPAPAPNAEGGGSPPTPAASPSGGGG